MNDVNTFKVDHPLWAGPTCRTWQTFHTENTHETRSYIPANNMEFNYTWTSLTRWVFTSVCRLRSSIQHGSRSWDGQSSVCLWDHRLLLFLAFTVESLMHSYILAYMAMEALDMAKQQGRQRSCCFQPHNTAYMYYTLHFRICRVVQFWCGRLLVLTAIIIADISN